MTESALGSLVLCLADDQEISAARPWLQAHVTVEQNRGNAYQWDRLLYHLYALERASAAH